MQMTRGRAGGLATALVMLVGMLGAVLVPTAPAHAYGEQWPQSCAETMPIEQLGQRLASYSPMVEVVDMDVTVLWWDSQMSQSDVRLVSAEGFEMMLSPRGYLDGYYSLRTVTFDDDAPRPGPGSQVEELRVRPESYLPSPRAIGSQLEVRSDFRTVYDVTVTLTYSDCDTDGDSIPDRQRDNCDGVANPDQRDRDGDGWGDACDNDNDNDAVADTSDNCPMMSNGDQANFDGDAAGDACDGDDDNDGHPDTGDACPKGYGDPCPPPPPTAPQPPAPTNPGSNPGGTIAAPAIPTTAPPAVRRSVVLSVTRRRVLKGTVSSATSACTTRTSVRVLRKKKGRDRVVARTRAGLNGAFKVKVERPLRPGRYYARVGAVEVPGPVACSSDRSDLVRVRRR